MKANSQPTHRDPITRFAIVGFFVILAISGALRFQAIRWGLPNSGRFTTLYIDEYTCLRVLSQMDPRHWRFNPHYFIDPTFFYYQVGIVLKLAALTKLVILNNAQFYYLHHSPEYGALYVVGRALTAVYGVLTTGLLFVLGYEITDHWAGGLIAAGSYAVIPIAVISCHAIDVGVPVSFWIAASFACFIDAARHPQTHRVPLSLGFLFAGLAFSTKYTSAPIFLCGLASLWWCKRSLRTLGGVVVCALGGFLIGTPYAVLDGRSFWPQFQNALGQASHSLPTVAWSHFIYPFYHYPYAVGTLLSLLCVIGLFRAVIQKRPEALLALAFLLPFFFLLGKSNRHLARYVNETLPFLLPFGAQLLVSLWSSDKKILKALAAGLLIAGLSTAGYTIALNRSLSQEVDPRDQASAWIEQNIPAGTSIGIDNDVAEFMHPGHLYMQFWKGKRYPAEAVQGPDYSVVGWDLKNERWSTSSPPAYWVDTHYFFEYAEKDPAARAHNAAVLLALRNGYHPVQDFARRIHLGPITYAFPAHAGFDWSHFFPHLTVYKRDR